MLLNLTRLESSDHGTFGRITVGDKTFFTGELPWRGNRNFQSCIPLGIYKVVWDYSLRFGKSTYLVQNVPDRDGIRFHSANLVGDRSAGFRSQVDGCITLGLVLGEIRGQKAVLASKDAIAQFESLLDKKPFILEIGSLNAKLFA